MWKRDLGPAGYVNCKYVIKCQAQKTSFFYTNDFPESKNDPFFLQGNLTAGIFVHKMSSEYSKKRTVINIDSHVVSMCKENLDYSTCVMIIYYNAIWYHDEFHTIMFQWSCYLIKLNLWLKYWFKHIIWD